jgi:hypothetical protein
VGVCGVLGYLEAAIILGSVNLWYNVVVIYATLFAGLIPIEMLIRWVAGQTFGVSDAQTQPGDPTLVLPRNIQHVGVDFCKGS